MTTRLFDMAEALEEGQPLAFRETTSHGLIGTTIFRTYESEDGFLCLVMGPRGLVAAFTGESAWSDAARHADDLETEARIKELRS